MIIKRILFTLIMLFSIYGSCAVIWELQVPDFHYAYLASPWVLFITATLSWHKTFIWRRMMYMRKAPPTLSRGSHCIEKNKMRPSILERISIGLLLLAIAAILHQQGVANISWWIAAIISTWVLSRMALRRI